MPLHAPKAARLQNRLDVVRHHARSAHMTLHGVPTHPAPDAVLADSADHFAVTFPAACP